MDEDFSSRSRTEGLNPYDSPGFVGLLLHYPYVMLLLLEVGCLGLLLFTDNGGIGSTLRTDDGWWLVALPSTAVVLSAGARFLFFDPLPRKAPLPLRLLPSLLSIFLLSYILFLR